MQKITDRDWDDKDLTDKNRYGQDCVDCGEFFMGAKDKILCKICYNKTPTIAKLILLKLQNKIKFWEKWNQK